MRFKIEYKIYSFINKNPLLNDKEIADKLKMKEKKVSKYIRKLLKNGMIEFELRTIKKEKNILSGSRVYKATSFKTFMKRDEINNKNR